LRELKQEAIEFRKSGRELIDETVQDLKNQLDEFALRAKRKLKQDVEAVI
jgi:hypothetical protein